MNRLEYFRARLDATVSPVDVFETLQRGAGKICVVDVRNGPAITVGKRIKGALQLPQNVILERLDQIPKGRSLILYCWDVWCSLAAQAAVPLIERGYDVKELYGGMNAWKAMGFPTEAADAAALAEQPEPFHRS